MNGDDTDQAELGRSTGRGASANRVSAIVAWGVMGAAVLVIAFFVSQWSQAQETANREKCGKQLRAIGQAILLYSNDHRGQWPPTFDAMIATTDITVEVFICPSSHDVPAPQQTAAAFRASPKHCSYVYAAPTMRYPRLLSVPPVDAVVAHEPLGNHGGDGIHVLFADGHVEFVGGQRATHLLAELATGRNPPRPFTMSSTTSSASAP